MSKEKDISVIVKELDSLTIDDTHHIPNYIKNTKQKRERGSKKAAIPVRAVYLDADKKPLKEGDKVILLTGGVDNHKYEEAQVDKLPRTQGKWVYLIPKRQWGKRPQFTIRKYPSNVRKIESP